MKNMAITLLLLSAMICIRTAAFGATPPRYGGGHGRNPVTAKEAAEAKEVNEKTKKRIAQYLTDDRTRRIGNRCVLKKRRLEVVV